MNLRKMRAFTLLELIVAIVVLAVLAALAIPTFTQVVSKTKLETAEVTVASLGREVVAIRSLDQGELFTELNIMSAVKDLPLRAASEGVYAAAQEWKVLVAGKSFSTNSNILSVAMGGTPKGSKLGMAVYVPNVGCAYGLAEGTQVNSWSVLGAPMAICSGEVALAGPDSGITAPPAPGGLSLSMGECANGEEGVIVDWEGAEFAEVFVNGESLGGFGPGTCFPGLTLDDNITVNAGSGGITPGDPGELPDPVDKKETSVGSVLSGEVIEIRWDEELVKDATDLVITRNGTPLEGPFTGGVFYDTVGVPGEYKYGLKGNYGGAVIYYPSGVAKIKKPDISTSAAATNAATRGNTIRVQWGAVPDTATAPLGGYRVYHARDSNATEWELLADMPAPVTSTYYDHANLALGYHCYYVTAYGPGGESGRSAVSCAKVEIVPAPKGMPMTNISTAVNHTCGLAPNATTGLAEAYCWGDSRNARLGIALAAGNVLRPAAVTTAGTPLAGKNITDITTNDMTTCVIASGEVFCWGSGAAAGGSDSTVRKINVNVVPEAARASFTSVDTSGNHTCAVSAGKAYCWGDWGTGRLGNNTTVSTNSAVAVVDTGVLAGKTVTDVAVGNSHSCAIASGEAYCWGQGTYGQNGDGTFNPQNRVPVKVATVPGVFTNENLVSISAGYQQTCAANSDGQVFCWGLASKLGNPSITANAGVPTPVVMPATLANKKIVSLDGAVASFGTAATCGITEDSSAVCWGATAPTVVNFPSGEAGTSVSTLSTQGATTCATTGDGAYCWGPNTNGQNGDGTITSSTLPAPVNP